MQDHVEGARFRNFVLIWVGQLVSDMGSALTSFALGVWVYLLTSSVTKFALISVSATLPAIVISQLAGTLVDRWNRRWVMIFSECGAALNTLVVALLLMTDRFAIGHVYIIVALNSCFGAFRWSAYSSSLTLLVHKRNLNRANGMVQAGQALSQTISPALAGLLLSVLKLQSVVLIDFATFLLAILTLSIAKIPQPATSESKTVGRSLLRETAYGWAYIYARRGLAALMVFFAAANLMVGAVSVLVTPMVLGFANPAVLGVVISVGGIGMLVGSLVMGAWRGRRRIDGIFLFTLVLGFSIVISGLRPSARLIALAAFIFFFALPIINGLTQAILQTKVAAEVQGRVFSVSGLIAWSSLPIAYLLSGPLADKVFDPLLAVNGPLAGSAGRVIGTGPGRGIGLLFILLGTATMLTTVAGYVYPRLRLMEQELPDAVADEVPEVQR
jgi:DHA3 family macrolide efflux protein-like MFS transporter